MNSAPINPAFSNPAPSNPAPSKPSVTEALPDAEHRWRCSACGNLTRFDVVRTATTREFWHVALSGEPSVEEAENLADRIGSVTCRWCGRADAIEVVARPGVPSS